MKISRPVWLSPLQVWLPVGAVLSLLHRISGLFLFLLLPLFLLMFDQSLISQEGFDRLTQNYSFPLKVVACLIAWSLLHHLFAGIRLLLMDAGIGKDIPVARRSAQWIFGLVFLLVFLFGAWLW